MQLIVAMEPINLKKLLKTRRMTMDDLGLLMSVNKATISRWGSRRVPADRVVQLAKVLGIPRSKRTTVAN